MLEKKVYSRAEIEEIFKTNRIDTIKRSLDRKGYSYNISGRGKQQTIEILDISKDAQFKDYCIETLKFSPSTDFEKLKYFLYLVLNMEGFSSRQQNEMVDIIKEKFGISVCVQTISKYVNHLKGIDWLHMTNDAYVYYIYDKESKKPRYISRGEYTEIYRYYWSLVKTDSSNNFFDADKWILETYGSKPKKRLVPEKTAFSYKQYEAVQLLLKDIGENEDEC